MSKIFCFLFGHKWELLRVGHGKTRIETDGSIKMTSMKVYWHWKCENCNLYSCSGRFKRYIK